MAAKVSFNLLSNTDISFDRTRRFARKLAQYSLNWKQRSSISTSRRNFGCISLFLAVITFIISNRRSLEVGSVQEVKIGNYRFFLGTNICLKGTSDGVYLKHLVKRMSYQTNIQWPLGIHALNTAPNNAIHFTKGTMYISNCWRKPKSDTNPAHWAMKLGVLLYLFSRDSLVADDSIIDGIVFHQCANPFMSNWTWGEKFFQLTVGHSRVKNKPLFWVDEMLDGKKEYVCFEKAIWDNLYSIWIRQENLQEWRDQIHDVYSHLISKDTAEFTVAIFQRTGGLALRRFENLDEMVDKLQAFLDTPIKKITTDENSSIEEQVKLFNSFDLLLTPHGSHLTNMLFTLRNVTIVEIVACPSDLAFSQNGIILGVHYIVSPGHQLGTGCNHSMGAKYETIADEDIIEGCTQSKLNTKQCDIIVNLTKISEIVNTVLNDLSYIRSLKRSLDAAKGNGRLKTLES